MKTAILLTLFLLQAVGLSSKVLQPSADADALNDTLFVYLNDGGMDAYPSSLASISRLPDGAVEAVWKDGTIITYPAEEVDSISHAAPAVLPRLTQLKINNKHNDQVFTDVLADITDDGQVNLQIGAIGKWLTPSFQLSDESATAYIGHEPQQSMVSRHRFDKAIPYTVAYPDMRILRQLSDEDGHDSLLTMMPFGSDYTVHVDWLTDRADNVPTISITTDDGKMITSKEVYVGATITIDGAGVFPSMKTTPVQIKGRGNSSWVNSASAKNPYRLKFDEKVKPFGMTKGKSWVLLANTLKGSMMANAIGMKAACIVRTAGANHIIPVELYINGKYRGNYNFTEKVGFSNNSIDLEDESMATLLELDTYYDETYKFKSSPYNLPVNIKEPDFSENTTSLTMDDIRAHFNQWVQLLQSGEEIAPMTDIEYLARYLAVTDLICNCELVHPKSVFLYNEDIKNGGKYVFGPVWDFDWAFGYEQSALYFQRSQQLDLFNSVHMEARQFVKDLRYVSQQLDRAYYKVWTLLMRDGLEELLDFSQDYYDYARPSLEHNYQQWHDGNNYATVANNARKWLSQRAEYIYSHLTPYDLTEEELTPVTGIVDIRYDDKDSRQTSPCLVDVYTLQGICVKRQVPVTELRTHLSKGIYIVNGKKMSL